MDAPVCLVLVSADIYKNTIMMMLQPFYHHLNSKIMSINVHHFFFCTPSYNSCTRCRTFMYIDVTRVDTLMELKTLHTKEK